MKTLTTFLILIIFGVSTTFGGAKLMAQPANDLIQNAIDLGHGPVPYTHTAVDFPNATNTNDNTPGGTGCGLSQPGVWYKFTATKTGTVGAGMVTPNNPVVVFFTGPAQGVTSGMQLTHVAQENNPCAVGPTASIVTTPGVTYYLYAKNNQVSNVFINATNAFAVPENDLLANAFNLNQEEMPYTDQNIHFVMATDTNDGGQTGCTSGNFPGIWYKITPQQNGVIQASINTEFDDSIIVIYEALNANANTGTQLAWANQPTNPCGIGNFAEVNAVVGKTYYIFAVSAIPYADVTIDATVFLSTSTISNIDFSCYPNPVVDELHISAKSIIDTITIFNLLGQQVINQNVNSNSAAVTMSHLKSGIYMVEITSNGAKTTAKILKK